MRKTSIVGLLTLGLGLGLVALLVYTNETAHRVTSGAGERPRVHSASAPADRELGPTLHRNGLLLTH